MTCGFDIHTNVIIFSYVLIFLAAVSAILHLLLRGWRRLNGGEGIREHVSAAVSASIICRRAAKRLCRPTDEFRCGPRRHDDDPGRAVLHPALGRTGHGDLGRSFLGPWGWDPKEVPR